MAIYTLAQPTVPGIASYPGTAQDDIFYVPFSRTSTGSFLSGTYTIDSAGLGGNDAVVFRATDVFNGSTSIFFPQFELSAGNTPVWTAFDQRTNPLRLEWNSFGSGDSGRLEVLVTPPGSTTATTAVVINNTLTYITQEGTAAPTSQRTGAAFARESQTDSPGYEDYISDPDQLYLGQFYVNDDMMLSSNAVSAAFDGTSVASLANGGFDKFIFNTISGLSGSFTPSSPLESLQVDIRIDNGALDGARKYLNLAGSVGSPTPTDPSTNFTSLIPDVDYRLLVDLDAAAGVTVKETDTGLRNWWDNVSYSDIGIMADGKSGLVNSGSSPNSTQGVTLSTGNFTATGGSFSSFSLNSVATSGADTNFITLQAGHGFAVGDKLIYSEQSNGSYNLYSGGRYLVTDVSGDKVKVVDEFNPQTTLNFGPGYQLGTGATFQKTNDYDVTVLRHAVSATDVYGGFEAYRLTTGQDVINYNGGNNFSIEAGRGNDIWNIAASNSNGWNQLDIRASNNFFAGETTGLFVNLSGNSKTWGSTTLTGSSSTGQMRDGYGTIDTFNISSGYNYTHADNVRLNFDTSVFADRFYLAADGMGTFAQYQIRGSGGNDQYHLSSATLPSMLAAPPTVTTSNLSGLTTGFATAVLEEGTRFFDSSSYKITFATVGSGGSQKMSATLYDIGQISNVTAAGDISVSDTSGWSIGDKVIYRQGTEGVSGLTNGASYTVTALTGGTVRLQTTVGTLANPITVADTQTSGSYLEHIVSTSGVVDGVYNSANKVVNGGYVNFADDAGQFSRMAIRVDGKITENTVLNFSAQTNVTELAAGSGYWVNDLATSQGHAAFSIDYQDLYDGQNSSVKQTGILYVNGIVDKGALGFDRLVDYSESAYVGARSYSMTEYDDVLVQTTGTGSVALSLTAGGGKDKIFVEGVSSDPNQLININLGGTSWGSPDNEQDVVEIGVSKLATKYDRVQYIDVTNADYNDSIKFVDAAGYTVVKNSAPMSYNTYSVYKGENSTTDNLVMQVRVTENNNFSTNGINADLNNANWGQKTDTSRSITGYPTPVSMTVNADSALLFEDTVTTPYLMKAGDDYVVTMGGDQDIFLGAGNDFLSIRNNGQQLFVSGGAGTDTLGLGGSFYLLGDGTYVSDQWSFSSIDPNKAKEFITEKYPLLPTTTDLDYAWDSTLLDRVMVATNRIDGTTVYFQAEELGFSNGTLSSGLFLPPISENYDTTARSMANTILYGRDTNDTVNLKVANVDEALMHIGTWLNSNITPQITTGNTLQGSHTLEILAQTTATPWFTGSSTVTNAGFKLVDIENIRLYDANGGDITVRVAGSSSYDSVEQAIQYANRGDVIFIAETKQGALTVTAAGVATRATVNMDNTVSMSGGLRVAFEEGTNRTLNLPTDPLKVNMTGNIKSHETDTRFFGSDTNSLELLGAANVNVNGSALSDLIVGNKGNNVISGMAGNDIIFGGRGSDILVGGVGNDVLVGGSSDRITGAQHTPDDGAFTGFNLTTDATRFNDASALEFQTGDKVIYKASGGSGISVAGTGLLTETTPLFVIVGNVNTDGSVDVKLASSLANARSGVALDIISNGNATTHGVTIDNGAYGAATTNPAAVSLAGSDYLYGGSGQDHLIATGVTGSLTTANVRDVLTMSGGSGNDEFSILGNSGKINIIGGSGSDKVNVFDNFLDIVGVNKAARVLDFSAAQDDILSTFNPADLGVVSVESRLSNSGFTLSQLVSPPLPIVSGDAENGNYQETNGEIAKSIIVELNDYSLNIADLINLHQAHAA